MDLVRFLHREYETFPEAQPTILDMSAEGEKSRWAAPFRYRESVPMLAPSTPGYKGVATSDIVSRVA